MRDDTVPVLETAAGLEVKLHVLPRARHSELCGVHNGALKLRITAPPVDDAANRAIINFFSSKLAISKSSIGILTGQKSRDKVVLIKNLSHRTFLKRLTMH